MKITYVEFPEGLIAEGSDWEDIRKKIASERPDVLVTNEMPFGKWLSASNNFDAQCAEESISAHDIGINALKELNIPLILSSRPIKCEDILANEAFALVNGEYSFAHQKHYFPEETGFYETSWFRTVKKGFDVFKSENLAVGVLLCTEIMFNEWARSYRYQGAQLIVVPRATEQSFEKWKTAASMAAIVSGCYVVSSNRVGRVNDHLVFGGKGFAFAPDGSFISETSTDSPIVSFELDLELVKKQQKQYPCYVRETFISQCFPERSVTIQDQS